VACAWFGSRPATAGTTRPFSSRLPQLALVTLAAAGAAGLLIGGLVPMLAGTPGSEVSRGAVAAIRTAVLVAGMLFLAWAGRHEPWREAGWLAYPLLVITGVKFLFEDLPSGKPATLMVSLGLYGAALLLVPRLRPRAAKGAAAVPAEARHG
jgi:hypothetical protein